MFLPGLLLAQPVLELGADVNQTVVSSSAILAVDSAPGYVA